MLLGEFRHSLDAKGRIFLPARWREELAEGVVVTKGLEGCLYVLPKDKFQAMSLNLEQLPLEHKANRDYSRLFFSGASEEAVDKQGRMNIPSSLREYAALSKDVVVVGVSGRGEIWDKAKWQQYQQGVEGEYASIAEQLDL